MKIKTALGTTGEWQVEVHTSNAQYPNKGKYYTWCGLKNYRGETVRLVSKYTHQEKEATDFHQELCKQAKEFLIR